MITQPTIITRYPLYLLKLKVYVSGIPRYVYIHVYIKTDITWGGDLKDQPDLGYKSLMHQQANNLHLLT